ncbi:YjcQ family protein [Helcococcus kunzii]|uniref:YjcQ family protein n=1 Tax=Helcococcus kunzii TaxID=40091 RepID=UPI003D2BDB6D
MLKQSGYIIGIVIDQTHSDYSSRIVEPITPRITLKGLEYLQENSMMKKAFNSI